MHTSHETVEAARARLERDTAEALAHLTSLTADLGPNGPAQVAACREQVYRDSALAAHEQARAARRGLCAAGEIVHQLLGHKGDWRGCDGETCSALHRDLLAAQQVTPEPRDPVPSELIALVASSILCRRGDVVDEALADERARNLSCWVLYLLDAHRDFTRDILEEYEAGKLGVDMDDYANTARELLNAGVGR